MESEPTPEPTDRGTTAPTQFSSAGALPAVAPSASQAQVRPSASELAFFDEEYAPASEAETLQQAPELAGESEGTATPDTDERRLSLRVPLTTPTRAAISAAYSSWKRSGVIPPFADIHEKLSLDWIQVAGPMDRVRASMLYPRFSCHESAATLFPKLLGLTKLPGRSASGPAPLPINYIHVVSRADVLRELRVGRSTAETKTSGGSRLDTGVSEDTLSWLWGLVQGDFNKDPDTAQTVINGLAGLIPGVDQVLDGRDMVANLVELVYEGRYDDAGVWFAFATTLIGAIPEVGSAIKAVARVGAKAAGGIGTSLLRMISGWADVSRLTTFVMDQGQRSFNSAIGTLQAALVTVGRLSEPARVYVSKLLDNARAALAQLATRARAAAQEIKQRLEELLAGVARSDADMVDTPTVRTDTPTVRTDTPTVRTDTPTVRTDTPTVRTDTPTVRTETEVSPKTADKKPVDNENGVKTKQADAEVDPTTRVARNELEQAPMPTIDVSGNDLKKVNASGHRNAGLYRTEIDGTPAFIKVLNQGEELDVVELATARRLSDIGVGPRVIGETLLDGRRALVTEDIADGIPVGVSTSQLKSQNVLGDSPEDRLAIVEQLERFGPLVQNAGIEVSHDLQFLWSPSAKRLYMIDAQKAELFEKGKAASFSAIQFNTLARDLRETWGLPKR